MLRSIDYDHELTDEQRDKLRKAIGEIVGDFTPWILHFRP